MGPLRLFHLHLPLTSYLRVQSIQEHLVRRFLLSKAKPAQIAAPPPTIITTEFHPVYTFGRRERNSVTPTILSKLQASGRAEVHTALRGGQITFHGPGQLVAYPIIDLKSHGLSPRCYVRDIENAVIEVLRKYGIRGFRTDDTGVWTSEVRKIASIGVHMRRNITSHGVAINVGTDLWWLDKIVACGLEGKEATSFEREGVQGTNVEHVGTDLVEALARLWGYEGIDAADLNTVGLN